MTGDAGQTFKRLEVHHCINLLRNLKNQLRLLDYQIDDIIK